MSINLLKNTYDMANHRITMKQLQKLIEYQISGKSKRWIAQSLGLSRNTVDNYLGYFRSEVGQDLSSLLNWSEEALYRLVISYLAIGLYDEAQASAAVLGHNYSDSDWYSLAYEAMQGVKR